MSIKKIIHQTLQGLTGDLNIFEFQFFRNVTNASFYQFTDECFANCDLVKFVC